jgi:hypothetical protein
MKKKISPVFLLLVIISMLPGACAYVPPVPVASPQMDMKMKNMTPPPDKALLYVYRDLAAISYAAIHEISIDGYPVGKLAQTTYLAVLLESGKHQVISNRFDDGSKVELSINARAGNTYYAETSTSKPYLFVISEDKARKALANYKLIYESEEPIQITSAKSKSTNVAVTLSTDPMPVPAITVLSDVDELPLAKVKQNRNAYAIVIGIEQYRQKLPKADFAASDARLVSEYLTKAMGYPEENVITLLNDRALKSDFEKYFEKWLGNNVETGSTVFVYFSGHGAPEPKSGNAYLVPYDGDPSFIDQTGYSLKRMYDALGKLPAKEIIVALDSCFSGAGGRSVLAKGARPLVMNLQSNMTLSGNMTVLSASSGEQISSTYDEKGHGLFTYFMLKGIKNEDVVRQDGSIKMDDLFSYIKPQVERIARKQYNNEQTPQLMGAKKN